MIQIFLIFIMNYLNWCKEIISFKILLYFHFRLVFLQIFTFSKVTGTKPVRFAFIDENNKLLNIK